MPLALPGCQLLVAAALVPLLLWGHPTRLLVLLLLLMAPGAGAVEAACAWGPQLLLQVASPHHLVAAAAQAAHQVGAAAAAAFRLGSQGVACHLNTHHSSDVSWNSKEVITAARVAIACAEQHHWHAGPVSQSRRPSGPRPCLCDGWSEG